MHRVSRALLCLVAWGIALVAECRSSTATWRAELARTLELLADPAGLREDNCATAIHAFIDPLYARPASAFVPANAREAAQLRRDGVRLMAGFFRVRLLLKERFRSFASPGPACVEAVRRGLRYSRFAEDYLGDWLKNEGVIGREPVAIFSGGPPHTFINPKFGAISFRTGDVLIMRSMRFVSAMIARLGDEDSDFSHLAIVGEDGAGNKHIVQSLIEQGTVITPIEKFLAEQEGRIALLRFRDAAVAGRAGRAIYGRAAQALAQGAAIPYDYRFDSSEHAMLYCAELAEYAYELASGGRVRLPRDRSSLRHLAGTPFLRDLGIGSRGIFAAADAELDPRFDVVAEYSNIPKSRALRMQNVAVTALYGWFARGYEFQPNPASEALAHLGLVLIRSGLAGSLWTQKHVPEQMLAVLLKSKTVVDELTELATAYDRRYAELRGYAPTFRELLLALEAARRKTAARRGARAPVR